MNRREAIKVGLLGVVIPCLPVPHICSSNRIYAQHGHFFDWSEFPFTTDPSMKGKLDCGWHNHCSCDGKEYLYVRSYVTGPSGWLEYLRLNDKGERFLEIVHRSGKVVQSEDLPQVTVRDSKTGRVLNNPLASCRELSPGEVCCDEFWRHLKDWRSYAQINKSYEQSNEKLYQEGIYSEYWERLAVTRVSGHVEYWIDLTEQRA